MIEDFHYARYLDQIEQVNRAKEHLRLNHTTMNPELKQQMVDHIISHENKIKDFEIKLRNWFLELIIIKSLKSYLNLSNLFTKFNSFFIRSEFFDVNRLLQLLHHIWALRDGDIVKLFI